MTKATILCSALALLVLGCSSGQQAPASAPTGVATYGPTSRTAPPPPAAPSYAPAPAPRYAPPAQPAMARPVPQPAPAYAPAGTFQWHTRIADAQAQARREGKLILVGTTQSGCGLCEKFKNQIVPRAASRVSPVAVGYMLQARSPEAPAIWQQLRANLPNAGLMPLVGVFTPDLRYLTGFGGPPDEAQLMNALATARRLYPVSARPVERTVPADTNRVAASPQRNEYGEYEWTPLAALYPEPEDALTPEGVVADADPVLPPAPDAGSAAAPLPPAPVQPAPTAVAARPAAPVPHTPVAVAQAPARVIRATTPSAPVVKTAAPPVLRSTASRSRLSRPGARRRCARRCSRSRAGSSTPPRRRWPRSAPACPARRSRGRPPGAPSRSTAPSGWTAPPGGSASASARRRSGTSVRRCGASFSARRRAMFVTV